MDFLSKDAILNADDLNHIEMEIPEWGGKIRIGVLSGFDRERFEREWVDRKPGVNDCQVRVSFLLACIVDEQGNPMFTREDLERLNKKNWKVLDRIMQASIELSAIGDKGVEGLAKN